MNNRSDILMALAACVLAAQHALAQPATNILAGFQVKKGFRLELVASEPLVFDPVAMAFDADGRLFVAEDRDYPGPDSGSPHLGRVRLLEDNDGDGRYDTSKDFIEDLQAPSALLCWDHGVIVAAGTEILHCKDTDDDGRADERKTLFVSTAIRPERAELPLPIRSFVWGLDHRIHAAFTGPVTPFHGAEEGFRLDGHDFAFDPHTQIFEAESSRGSTGLSFDGLGRRLVCAPAHPLRQVMWEGLHAAHTNGFVLPPPMVDISGPASATPLMAMRVVGLPASSGAPGAIAKRVTEYFSAASSLVVYHGNAFPASFNGDVFVADARANVIHRFKLRPNGIVLSAERPADELGAEFLATTNTWFRPMQLTVGPDGALYVADLHREFLDPPSRLPESQRAAAARRRGNDRGRLYRIVPEGFKPPPAPRLAKAKLVEIATNLAHTNSWHRDTAMRLFCEQRSPSAPLLLSNMLFLARSPFARLYALATLDGLGALDEKHVAQGLRDTDDRVCILAIRLADRLGRRHAAKQEALWPALQSLAADASPAVRFELALACSDNAAIDRDATLVETLSRDPEQPWMRAAVLNALASDPADSLRLALGDVMLRRSDGGQAFLHELAWLLGTRNVRLETSRAFVTLERLAEAKLRLTLLHQLDEGLRGAGSQLARVVLDAELRPLIREAREAAAGGDEALRVAGIRFLAAAPFDEVRELLLDRIVPAQSEMVQLAAVQTLARFNDARVGPALTQRWGEMPEPVRLVALDALLARTDGCRALLAALQDGQIPRDTLSTAQVVFLRTHPDATVSRQASAWFNAPGADRAEMVRRLQPALSRRGDSAKGRQSFLTRCAECHRYQGEGAEFGPDLESVAGRSPEWLLTQIADPNKLVSPEWTSQVIETRSFGSLLGVIEHESEAGIVLRQSLNGRTPVPRCALQDVRSLNTSAMPEALETNLPPQAMADLLEFLSPRAR